MKILKTQTLQGPNYWSVSCSKLNVVLLDLEELVNNRTIQLSSEFYSKIRKTLPSLEERSNLPENRVLLRDEKLTSCVMCYLFKQIALELQTLAGMPVAFGDIRETELPGVYQIAVEYQIEAAGCYATRAALRLCQNILDHGTYPKSELQKDLEDLIELRAESALGATTEALMQEAEILGIPWIHLEHSDLFQIGYGKYQKRVQAALTSASSVLGVELACDKERTKKILDSMGIPVPFGQVIYAFRELEEAIHQLGGYPIVIKPLDGNQGRGITIDIRSWKQAEVAYDRAKDISNGVIVERFYQGRDHRILLVNHKMVAVAERVPAHVVGNGNDTISALIERENQDIRRGEGHDKVLTQIKLDDSTDEMLRGQGFHLDTILPENQICYLRANANLSTGGIAIDRTEEIHPETVWLAERVSKIIDLDIAGIDVITTDITKPLNEVGGVIVEVNAAPGLRMHLAPSQGVARNVAAPILNMLFPPGSPTRIPIVAVAETYDKNTPTPLIAHIFNHVYDAVGCSMQAGIYIDNHLIEPQYSTGFRAAQLVLQDPTVDLAVLEVSHCETLGSGLPFQYCDVGVVLNSAEDSVGSENVCYRDRETKLRTVICEAVHRDGYVVLNADDDKVEALSDKLCGAVAYYSMDAENPVVRSHIQQGGIAAIYEQSYLSIVQKTGVERVYEVEPGSHLVKGGEPISITNILIASLVAYVQGLTVEQIRAALNSLTFPDQRPPDQTDKSSFGPLNSDLLIQSPDLKSEAVMAFEPQCPQPGSLLTQGDRHELIPAAFYELPQGPTETINNGDGRQVSTAVESSGNENSPPPLDALNKLLILRLGLNAKDKYERTLKTVMTAADSVKQRGFKAWVSDKGLDIRSWVKEKTPVLQQIARRRIKQLASRGLEMGIVLGTIVIALGLISVEAALAKTRGLGAIAFEKVE